eukprot:m.7180 g.7180  ORF g.7180 m.7180 type:complete len:201 (+) comp5671_c0_seq2:71-673(+)
MLIVFSGDHKKHLQYLNTLDIGVAEEFCTIAIQFLQNGVNAKVYSNAAKKLGTESETVRNIVEAVMFLLVECSKLQISEMDFHDSMLTLQFSDELNKILLDCFIANQTEIRGVLEVLSLQRPKFKDVQWRLDVKVASRSLRETVEPSLVMSIATETGDASESKTFQTDISTLNRITQQLDSALKHVNTSHYRRIGRAVKV